MGKRNISAAASAAVVVLGLTTAFLATHGSQKPTDGATESMQNEARTAVADIQAESMPTTRLNAVEQPAANMQPSLSVPIANTTPLISNGNLESATSTNAQSKNITEQVTLSEIGENTTTAIGSIEEKLIAQEMYIEEDSFEEYVTKDSEINQSKEELDVGISNEEDLYERY